MEPLLHCNSGLYSSLNSCKKSDKLNISIHHKIIDQLICSNSFKVANTCHKLIGSCIIGSRHVRGMKTEFVYSFFVSSEKTISINNQRKSHQLYKGIKTHIWNLLSVIDKLIHNFLYTRRI